MVHVAKIFLSEKKICLKKNQLPGSGLNQMGQVQQQYTTPLVNVNQD